MFGGWVLWAAEEEVSPLSRLHLGTAGRCHQPLHIAQGGRFLRVGHLQHQIQEDKRHKQVGSLQLHLEPDREAETRDFTVSSAVSRQSCCYASYAAEGRVSAQEDRRICARSKRRRTLPSRIKKKKKRKSSMRSILVLFFALKSWFCFSFLPETLTRFLKGQRHDIQWFFCAFLREQKMATARASVADISSVCHANSFTAPAESRKCRFPQAIVVFRGLALWPPLLFPTQNGCQKITNYHDTAA